MRRFRFWEIQRGGEVVKGGGGRWRRDAHRRALRHGGPDEDDGRSDADERAEGLDRPAGLGHSHVGEDADEDRQENDLRGAGRGAGVRGEGRMVLGALLQREGRGVSGQAAVGCVLQERGVPEKMESRS